MMSAKVAALKGMVDKIQSMKPCEQEEVLKIIQSHEHPVTRNKNGVFMNASTMSAQLVKQLMELVSFWNTNQAMLLDDRNMDDWNHGLADLQSDVMMMPPVEPQAPQMQVTSLVARVRNAAIRMHNISSQPKHPAPRRRLLTGVRSSASYDATMNLLDEE
jgi:hypothetical protein